jgi:Rod binding domain-containing protein
MANTINTLFSDSIFGKTIYGARADSQTDRKHAAESFTEIFASMLSKQMRQSMVGPDKGPMGIAGGSSGDIYGSFFDQAMGHALANSRAMEPLNRLIRRELAGSRHPDATGNHGGSQSLSGAEEKLAGLRRVALINSVRDETAVPSQVIPHAMPLPFETDGATPSDEHGPLLLPPRPTTVAPLLRAPS